MGKDGGLPGGQVRGDKRHEAEGLIGAGGACA